jgi:hypothetical protein
MFPVVSLQKPSAHSQPWTLDGFEFVLLHVKQMSFFSHVSQSKWQDWHLLSFESSPMTYIPLLQTQVPLKGCELLSKHFVHPTKSLQFPQIIEQF